MLVQIIINLTKIILRPVQTHVREGQKQEKYIQSHFSFDRLSDLRSFVWLYPLVPVNGIWPEPVRPLWTLPNFGLYIVFILHYSRRIACSGFWWQFGGSKAKSSRICHFKCLYQLQKVKGKGIYFRYFPLDEYSEGYFFSVMVPNHSANVAARARSIVTMTYIPKRQKRIWFVRFSVCKRKRKKPRGGGGVSRREKRLDRTDPYQIAWIRQGWHTDTQKIRKRPDSSSDCWMAWSTLGIY